MAEARRNWFMAGALLLGALSFACAQAPQQVPAANPLPIHSVEIQALSSGSLAGRLTDLHSAPLAGVPVLLRNLSTGAEVQAITAKNGAFRFDRLDAGEYTLEADAPQLGHGELDGIFVTGGAEARVQAAMRFEPAAHELIEAAAPSVIPAQPFAAATMPLPARAVPGNAGAAVLTSPTVSRAASGAENSQTVLIASIGPLTTSTAPRGLEIVRPSRPPAASLTAASLPPMRAALETQSPAISLSLAVALPHTLPLTFSTAPVIPLGAAIASGLRAALQVGKLSFSPVAGAMQRPDPGAASTTTTIASTQLQSLPAGGRRWQEFLADTPASNAGTDSSQQSYRSSQESPEVTIDGANISLKFGIGAGSAAGSTTQERAIGNDDRQNMMGQSMSQAWNGGRGMDVSEAAIHEVTATAGNVEAEGMRSAGGRTGIDTEHGGNALHGQGFYYDRQNNWGARNPYTQWLQNTGMAPTPGQTPVIPSEPVFNPISYTPPDHEAVWGVGMGSRLRRDKLFWFGALDSYRRNDPGMAMAKWPISPAGTGVPCGGSGTQLCPVGLFASPSDAQFQLLGAQLGESTSQAASDYFGIPGSASVLGGLEQLSSVLGPAPRTASQWMGFGRIDWQAAERHHFALEGSGADWNAPGGGITRLSGNYGDHSFGSSHASEQWLLARWEAFLTPNLLAVTQGSAGRTILTARAETPSAFEQAFLSGNVYGQLPEIIVDSRYGFTIGNPSRFGQGSYPDEKLYHVQEMLDWVHGKLLIKSGFELEHNSDATSLLRNQSGTYHYANVANFISDALSFEKYGFADALDPANPHHCDATGKPWYTSNSQLMGLGALPCYTSYSQMMGPTNWRLSTNDWAGYITAQWQAGKFVVFSAGLRWEREQLPPPLAAVDNPQLPFTERTPALGNNWGPRVSVAIGSGKDRWPVLRLGYGMYYGRVVNSTIEAALTQTGSANGDQSVFLRPQDDCQYCAGGAPPFPHVLEGQPTSFVKPGVVGFAPSFRNPEAHQAVVSVEHMLPGGVMLTAGGMLGLGRRLPVPIDTNVNSSMSNIVNGGITFNVCDQAPYVAPGANQNGQSSGTGGSCGNLGQGPIKAARITIPYFYASWPDSQGAGICPYYSPASGDILLGRLCPDYQAITQIMSKANSTYEAGMVKLVRYGRRGLNFHAHYTFAHAADWNPEGVTLAPESSVLDPNPADFAQEYGTSDLDVRHSVAAIAIYEAPWKLHGRAGRFANGWMLSGIGQFRSGLPYSMRVSGSLPEEFTSTGAVITGLGPSLNGYGGDNRYPFLPRNTFRYPQTWKADLRLGKRFDLGEMRQLELLAETFNLFNHENVTEIETTGYFIDNGSPPSSLGGSAAPPSLNFLTGLYVNPKSGLASPAFGQPLNINGTNFYRERQFQFGVRMRF